MLWENGRANLDDSAALGHRAGGRAGGSYGPGNEQASWKAATGHRSLRPAATSHTRLDRLYEPRWKTIFDAVVAAMSLVLSLPLLVGAAVLVLLEDGRPVIFSQWRVGRAGRLFRIYKFRTMFRGAESVPQSQKSKSDPRVTRVGRLLRRSSIDELPQLWNVLRGEMSLVGPRPELPEVVRAYAPWQLQRLSVLPGITGWWQVTGRSDQPLQLHTEADLYYLQHRSFWMDLRIIAQTLVVVVSGRGAY